MYLRHFGLRDKPFGLTPDTDYFVPLEGHREALEVLRVALDEGEGFIKVVGEVGTGKTMLCRKLLATLGPGYETAWLPNPPSSPRGVLAAVAQDLGIALEDASVHRVIEQVNERVLEIHRSGRQAVLVVDEAQSLPVHSLEVIRLLTNLETERSKLLQVVLFGQPELDERLAGHALRQLRQRISFSARLQPLGRGDTRGYVAHRLSVAGRSGDVPFTRGAIGALHRASGGIPRVVNLLGHKAMMAAYGRGEAKVRRRHVRRAIADTDAATSRRWFR